MPEEHLGNLGKGEQQGIFSLSPMVSREGGGKGDRVLEPGPSSPSSLWGPDASHSRQQPKGQCIGRAASMKNLLEFLLKQSHG